jgi:hypothetical protein
MMIWKSTLGTFYVLENLNACMSACVLCVYNVGVVCIQRGSYILQDSSYYDGNYSDSQDSPILYTQHLFKGEKYYSILIKKSCISGMHVRTLLTCKSLHRLECSGTI